jgi:GT2 family glycosyltransferase
MVYIIILNWNCWYDTIECLESVFRLSYARFKVIVCDNDSSDGSIMYIRAWAEGDLNVFNSPLNPLRNISWPPVQKPLKYVEYDRDSAVTGGKADDVDCNLILIQTGANLGFAGGNNVGITYAMTRGDFKFAWLLNNDTVVTPNALTSLLLRMREFPHAGMCGSALLYYDRPEFIQALGGAVYNRWLATCKHIGAMQQYDSRIDSRSIEERLDYIVGASMLVSKEFLQEIGLMCEEYFLYFEEIDWAMRAKNRFSLKFASDSVIFHKEGRSIGSSWNPNERTDLADFYGIRNRLVFTSKHYPKLLPIIYISFVGVLLNRIRRRQWGRAKTLLAVILEFLYKR